MADRRASGVTAPQYQLYQPDAIEQALTPAIAGPSGSGVFAPATMRFALRDAMENAANRQTAYGGALDLANRRAMAIADAENQAALQQEVLKQVGGIAQKDPTLLPILRSGDLMNPGLSTNWQENFIKMGLMDRLAQTYKTTGEGAKNMSDAGRASTLPSLNSFLGEARVPQSLESVPTSVQAASAGNPTRGSVEFDMPLQAGGTAKVKQTVPDNMSAGQVRNTLNNQMQGAATASGQGRVLSATELTSIRQQIPGAQVDSRVGVNPDGSEYITIKPKGSKQAVKLPVDLIGKVDIVVGADGQVAARKRQGQ